MTSKRKASSASKNEDFPKKKQKLGKKKLKPMTHTNISFKSKTIQLTSQNLRSNDVVASRLAQTEHEVGAPIDDDKSNEFVAKDFVTKRNLSLNDITNQFNHYNVKIQASTSLVSSFVSSFDFMLQQLFLKTLFS